MNILNLNDYTILKAQENDHDYRITAEISSVPFYCPKCLAREQVVGFGRLDQLYMDTPIHGKRVGIVVPRRRCKCKACGKTFMEPLPYFDEKRWATSRLVEYIEKQSLKRTFASISEDVGVDEKTVRNIFRDYIERLEKTVRFETPKVMGLDEVHIIKKPRGVIANVEERTIVNLLPNRNKDTIMKYLSEMPNRDQIQYVCMDMWEPYRQAVNLVLPQSRIVVDKFHVVRMANQGLDGLRKSLRENMSLKERRSLMRDRYVLLKRKSELTPKDVLLMEGWTANLPALGVAYDLKEAYFELFQSRNSQEARERYRDWLKQIPEPIKPYFQPLVTAMANWNEEIFAYFDHPSRLTNAYTEALNGLIKIMNRLGRGYSFEALRARILFTEGAMKQRKPKYPKNELAFKSSLYELPPDAIGRMAVCESQNWELGTDIHMLIRMIEKGDI